MNFSKYIGLPYKHLGRDFDGVDCFGLLRLIYKEELDIVLPDYTDLKYSKDWYKKEDHIVENFQKYFYIIDRSEKVFDCIIFYLNSGFIANHCGVYISDDKFIHIYEDETSMISRLSEFWIAKVYKHIRYKE